MRLYLGAYHFEGETSELLAGYDRMLQSFPLDILDVHIGVTREGGLTVFDACPSKAVHDAFVLSAEFLGAVASAGLPKARTEGIGGIHVAHIRQAVRL